jgi:hypothetical protein
MSGQYSNPRPLLVNHHKRTVVQVRLMLMKGGKDKRLEMFRQRLLSPDLKDAGATSSRMGKHGTKVQIVGENDVAVITCPFYEIQRTTNEGKSTPVLPMTAPSPVAGSCQPES